MGWKASCILASTRLDGSLASFPPHRPDLAQRVLSLLGGKFKSGLPDTFENGVYPNESDTVYVGAYDGAIIIGSDSLVPDAFTDSPPEICSRLETILPGARVLCITLHSVVNLFGYAWFEQGRRLRARAGSADDGVFFERGEPLPFELPLLVRSTLRDGERVFVQTVNGEEMEFDEVAFGEEFVMESCRPFLGCRLDEFDAWDLKMEKFKKAWW